MKLFVAENANLPFGVPSSINMCFPKANQNN